MSFCKRSTGLNGDRTMPYCEVHIGLHTIPLSTSSSFGKFFAEQWEAMTQFAVFVSLSHTSRT